VPDKTNGQKKREGYSQTKKTDLVKVAGKRGEKRPAFYSLRELPLTLTEGSSDSSRYNGGARHAPGGEIKGCLLGGGRRKYG